MLYCAQQLEKPLLTFHINHSAYSLKMIKKNKYGALEKKATQMISVLNFD